MKPREYSCLFWFRLEALPIRADVITFILFAKISLVLLVRVERQFLNCLTAANDELFYIRRSQRTERVCDKQILKFSQQAHERRLSCIVRTISRTSGKAQRTRTEHERARLHSQCHEYTAKYCVTSLMVEPAILYFAVCEIGYHQKRFVDHIIMAGAFYSVSLSIRASQRRDYVWTYYLYLYCSDHMNVA